MHPSTTSVYPQKRCIQVINFCDIQNLAGEGKIYNTDSNITLLFQISAPILFGGFILWEIYAHWKWRRAMRIIQSEETEARSTQFALEPMMLAERDRVFIKQLKV